VVGEKPPPGGRRALRYPLTPEQRSEK